MFDFTSNIYVVDFELSSRAIQSLTSPVPNIRSDSARRRVEASNGCGYPRLRQAVEAGADVPTADRRKGVALHQPHRPRVRRRYQPHANGDQVQGSPPTPDVPFTPCSMAVVYI